MRHQELEDFTFTNGEICLNNIIEKIKIEKKEIIEEVNKLDIFNNKDLAPVQNVEPNNSNNKVESTIEVRLNQNNKASASVLETVISNDAQFENSGDNKNTDNLHVIHNSINSENLPEILQSKETEIKNIKKQRHFKPK